MTPSATLTTGEGVSAETFFVENGDKACGKAVEGYCHVDGVEADLIPDMVDGASSGPTILGGDSPT